MSCPREMSTACVGLEGLPSYPVFFLEFTEFDVPPGYVGVDGKAMGHVVVEARPQRKSPSLPCIGAERLGLVVIAQRSATEYRCPNDSLRVQREAMHGERAYAGHLLVVWSQGGTDYIASAHGHTTVNLDLLKRLVGSMNLIAPASP